MRLCEKCADKGTKFEEYNTRLARCAKCGSETLCVLQKQPDPQGEQEQDQYGYPYQGGEWW